MKRFIYLSFAFLFLGLFNQSVFGQKIAYNSKEVGIRLAPSFGSIKEGELVWKRQVSGHAWKRLRVGELSVRPRLFNTTTASSRLSVAFGKERRYAFSKKSNWQFVIGHEYAFCARLMDRYTGSTTKNLGVSAGINGVLGLRYGINNRFGVSVETTPGVSVEKIFDGESMTRNMTNWDVHLFNPRITLTYKMNRKG